MNVHDANLSPEGCATAQEKFYLPFECPDPSLERLTSEMQQTLLAAQELLGSIPPPAKVNPRLVSVVGCELYAWCNQWDKASPEERASKAGLVREALHPFFLQSPFVRRAFEKPLGYAGDYGMVEQLANNTTQATTLIGKMLDLRILASNPAVSHRNRLRILENLLLQEAHRCAAEGRKCRILNIGCGPAIELRNFIRKAPESANCELVLMDFNAETIEYARAEVAKAMREAGREIPITFIQH